MNTENIKCPSCNNLMQLDNAYKPLKIIICSSCPRTTLFGEKSQYLKSWFLYENNYITKYNLVNILSDLNIIYAIFADSFVDRTMYRIIKTNTNSIVETRINKFINLSNKNLLDLKSFISKMFRMQNII